MRKEIVVVDENSGVIRITTTDERFYARPSVNPVTKLPEYRFVPSVTFITHSYPKGLGYMKWLANKGWDEAEAIKSLKGNKGSKVHQAVDNILKGIEVRFDSKFMNCDSGYEEELTQQEADAILSFLAWKAETEKEHEIETIANEVTLFSEKHGYAGTIDWLYKLTNKATKELSYWLVDFKTSPDVYTEHIIQVSAYKQAIVNGENTFEGLPAGVELKLAILNLGHRNKCRYKFTEVADKFDLFLSTKEIWAYEHGTEKPSQKDYPIVLSPGVSATEGEEMEGEDNEVPADLFMSSELPIEEAAPLNLRERKIINTKTK